MKLPKSIITNTNGIPNTASKGRRSNLSKIRIITTRRTTKNIDNPNVSFSGHTDFPNPIKARIKMHKKVAIIDNPLAKFR
jgi:hypothetical protein